MGNKYTIAQANATKEYMKDKHILRVVVTKKWKNEIAQHANLYDKGSMNAFIKRAIEETINNDLRARTVPQTNAEWVRSLSNDELEWWLTKLTDDAQLDCENKHTYNWSEWLNRESKGD